MLKRILITIAIALAVLAAVGFGLWKSWNASIDEYGSTPFGDGSKGEVLVEIPKGKGLRQIAAMLADAGLVRMESHDERRFLEVAKRGGFDRKIKTGEFAFTPPMTPVQVLEVIAKGKVKLYHCTVPEGLRLDEMVPVLEKCGYGTAADIDKAMHDPALIQKAGLKEQGSFEGYLWPDTYSFPKGAGIQAVLLKMVSRFDEEYAKSDARRQKGITLSKHEAATLASIIEKETGAAPERPRISCVFHNRLKKKMKLQTDPTVIYAKLLRYGSFDGDIKRADLEYSHPYNTYTVKGLPPGPIASAGKAALDAALNPLTDCDDLFFVACGGGTHKFCPDYECHKKWVDECQLGKKASAKPAARK